jgi:hypothetical protein
VDARQIIEVIERAFPLQPVPPIGLYQTHCADQLYMGYISEMKAAEAPGKDRSRTWNAYTDDEIRALNVAMPHQSPEGFVYFLPAYLCAALRQLALGSDFHDDDMLVTNTCSSLRNPKNDEYLLQRYALLTQAQREAVILFLEYVAASPDDYNAAQARKALGRYWRRSADES